MGLLYYPFLGMAPVRDPLIKIRDAEASYVHGGKECAGTPVMAHGMFLPSLIRANM